MHPRSSSSVAAVRAVLVAVAVLSATACGNDAAPARAGEQQAVRECREQWGEVGETVVGMDQDPNPSALAERWNSVIATVEYYKTTESAEDCQSAIETQLKSVTALREFSQKLRPYDMTYQLSQARAAADLYLADPLPEPVRDENGKLVRPPSKAAVAQALQTLTENAEQANQELAPGWEQTKSVDLTDVDALTKTMQDLDFLAQDSEQWRACEAALQVLVLAIRFQEGLVGNESASQPSEGPVTTP